MSGYEGTRGEMIIGDDPIEEHQKDTSAKYKRNVSGISLVRGLAFAGAIMAAGYGGLGALDYTPIRSSEGRPFKRDPQTIVADPQKKKKRKAQRAARKRNR